MKLKVYVAGKVSPSSSLGTSCWRDGFCRELSEKSGIEIINLDPTKGDIDQNDAELVVGRCCRMIREADIVIANLTDDISVGGSQEMLIAKRFEKPLIGIAPRGGKFNKESKEMFGRVYADYLDPFVKVACDAVAEDIDGCARLVKEIAHGQRKAKGLDALDRALEYYERRHLPSEKTLR
jgi:nucleoside 2-deoxyribosyltransferase